MSKSFLGRGWRFPVGVAGGGGIATSTEEESIRESLRIILGTAPGERVMRPDFGCYIHEFVFHPNSPSTAALVAQYAREAILKWEPRVRDVKAVARPDPLEDNKLLVSISFTIRTTNSLSNMVYPFFLRREQDL